MTIYDRMCDLADQLNAAGVRATIDPRNVNPPCVLVKPPELAYNVHAGHVTATITLVAYAPGVHNADSLKALLGPGGLVEQVDPLFDIQTGRPGADPDHPTYEMQWQEAI